MIDINFPSGYQSGTGVAVASGKILTAAHCLYNLKENHKGEKPTSIVLKFGRAGTSSYKEVTITDKTKMRVNSNWLSSTNNQDWDYDYGVIDVPTSVTDITGWFGYTATANTTTTYTVSGYPYVDKTIYDGKYLYTHSGKATQVNPNSIYHKINALRGVSGAPTYNSSNQVVGIFTWENTEKNFSTRMTSTIAAFIKS